MKALLISLALLLGLGSNAQITKATLQASGLTCSMCSKAVLNALQAVPFVEKVKADIKNQQYHITFRANAGTELDALTQAVRDAGFSVAFFSVTADVKGIKLEKDEHVKIGGQYFHFLNAANQQLDGQATFTIVDKHFTSARDHKKYTGMSEMECVRTGKAAECCFAGLTQSVRIYHAII